VKRANNTYLTQSDSYDIWKQQQKTFDLSAPATVFVRAIAPLPANAKPVCDVGQGVGNSQILYSISNQTLLPVFIKQS